MYIFKTLGSMFFNNVLLSSIKYFTAYTRGPILINLSFFFFKDKKTSLTSSPYKKINQLRVEFGRRVRIYWTFLETLKFKSTYLQAKL